MNAPRAKLDSQKANKYRAGPLQLLHCTSLPLSLPGCDESTEPCSWTGAEGGEWRSRLWFKCRLGSSVKAGLWWTGRLSWVCGSTGVGGEPRSASKACSLREGLWKQKQNMASGMQTGRDRRSQEEMLQIAWRVFSDSRAPQEQVLKPFYSPVKGDAKWGDDRFPCRPESQKAASRNSCCLLRSDTKPEGDGY